MGFPVPAMRKVLVQALTDDSGPDRARLYCPPLELIFPTRRKMQRERAKRVLLVPDWPAASWMQTVIDIYGNGVPGAPRVTAGDLCGEEDN